MQLRGSEQKEELKEKHRIGRKGKMRRGKEEVKEGEREVKKRDKKE
jgi:hypothetical protein